MARQRKVSHFHRIIDKSDYLSLSQMEIGSIYEFRYMSKDIYDVRPMVFILDKRGIHVRGININYLTHYRTDQLLQERKKWAQIPTLRLARKFQWYELYDKAIRTYKKSNIKMVRRIDYKYRTEKEI